VLAFVVYVPLGNQLPDQWGANRSANAERFSSSVVALDLTTGRVRWVFQTVHHDLWDYDVPSHFSLIDLTINGQAVPSSCSRRSKARSTCSIARRARPSCW
jgi:quinoprotein glucose dehydrogenase